MNKTKQIFINCIAIATLLLATSCEKELYDQAIKTNTSTGKSKPNIKVSSLNFTRNHPTIQKISQKTKNKLKTSRTNSIETNTLEAYFGEVKLDYGVEIIDSLNRKTTTFEVKETTVNPNEYYNFVIQNDSEFWLYKIEKIESTYKNYPANSTIVSRYSINDNLTMSTPCDTIVFPPFGEIISEVIPTGTGGGSVSIGNINNPTEGGGFGLGVGYGSGYFNDLGPGSGGSGNSGPVSSGNGPSGQSLALVQISDWLTDGWNWIKNLFGGCGYCGNRTSNRSSEEDLIVNSGGVVLEIKDSTVDCGEGGYVFITPQDEYVDKILEFENYFTYLHNNDRVFLYNNHHIVDYLYTLTQQNSNNANLMTILPELINKTRKGEITWTLATQLIDFGIDYDIESVNEFIIYMNHHSYSENSINFITDLINQIRNTQFENLSSNLNIELNNPIHRINNIIEYLKCFNLTEPASFTIYVDQPTPNSNEAWSGNPLDPDVGHTFISIKQGGIRRVLGYYPSSAVDLTDPSSPGSFENDSNHGYDVAISINITPSQLTNLINYIKSKANSTYNLNSFNCSDFGMGASTVVGMPLGSAYGSWGVGAGDNPGQLGQNIRNMPTPDGGIKTTTTGNAASNIGTCN